MAHPGVADGGRVATNVLNKQLLTADRGWSFSFGVVRGSNNSSPSKTACCEMLYRNSEWTSSCEDVKEPSGYIKVGKFLDQLSDC
jgi:hypothetical protein